MGARTNDTHTRWEVMAHATAPRHSPSTLKPKKLALQQGEQAGDQPAEHLAEQPSQVSPDQQFAEQQPEDLLKTLCGADQTKRSPTCIPMYTRSVQWTPCTKKEFCGISIGLSHTRRAIPLSKDPGFFLQKGGLGKVGARTNGTHKVGDHGTCHSSRAFPIHIET